MLCFSPLSRFVNVTAASLITAPLASVTVPVIVPYTFWPHPVVGTSAKRTVAASNASPRFLRFVTISSPSSHPEVRKHAPRIPEFRDHVFPLGTTQTGQDRGNPTWATM